MKQIPYPKLLKVALCLCAGACFGIGLKIAWCVYFKHQLVFELVNYFDAFSLILSGLVLLYFLFRKEKEKS